MIGRAASGRCDLCEGLRSPLYHVPDASRSRPTAPRAVCRFCYLRMVGIRPTRSRQVDVVAANVDLAAAQLTR